LAIGAAACGTGNLDKAGGPVSKAVVLTLAKLNGFEGHANLIDSGFAVPGAVLTGNVVFEPRPNVIFMNQRGRLPDPR
jgi:hypothetical protein